MGRHWRFFPALGLAAAVVFAGGRANAAAYANARSDQKPISEHGSDASGSPLTSEFGSFVLEQLEKWRVPGVAVAVIDGDDVYAEVRGLSHLASSLTRC